MTYTATNSTGASAQSVINITVPPSSNPPPSTKFTIGQRVQTTANLNVRTPASPTGTLLGTQSLGSLGSVTGGPVANGGYIWWQIDYDNAPDGWSAEDFLTSTSVTPPPPPPVSGVSLSLSPNSTSVAPNGTFTVNVILNTSGQSSAGVDLNKLRFNPAILQVVDSNTSLPGVQIAPGTIMPTNVANTVDNTQGTITFSQLTNPGTTYTGTGTLATITFRAIASGSSNVTFDFTSGSGIDTNVAGNGVDILQSVGNGTYTVN